MAMGSLGKLIHFTVSSKKVLTFRNANRTLKGRWVTHNQIRHRSRTEFLGREQNGLTMTIQLNVSDGIKNPQTVMHEMHLALARGTPMRFILGGQNVCNNRWVITDISEAWNVVMNNGKIVSATVDLTLMEYD